MLPAVSKLNADVPEIVETKSEILSRHKQQQSTSSADDVPQVPIIKEKLETHTELMLEPKSEYVDEMNEDSIEDLTLDDDDLSNMEQMDDGAGPSHGNAGEGSSQGNNFFLFLLYDILILKQLNVNESFLFCGFIFPQNIIILQQNFVVICNTLL